MGLSERKNRKRTKKKRKKEINKERKITIT